MARRVEKATRNATAPSGAVAVAELEILYPNREITLAGKKLLVREYGFVEGMRLRAVAAPFFASLVGMVDGQGGIPKFDEIEGLFADNIDSVLAMVAQSAGVEVEWITALNDEDGDRLMLTWWLVNAGFFIRRVLRRVAGESRLHAFQAGLRSSTPSSAPDTDGAPATSSDTPSDS